MHFLIWTNRFGNLENTNHVTDAADTHKKVHIPPLLRLHIMQFGQILLQNLKYGQIHFIIWTNTLSYLDKYI